MNTYFLDGKSLTVADLDQIVSQKYEIQLSEEAELDVLKSRQAVQEMMSDPNKVVYGINTGFGNFFDKVISLEDRKLLQINLICSHAVGVGKPVSTEIARREMVLRINTLAKGRSGISKINLQRMVDAFNKGFIPYIPEQGTVGASGDLAPLSHLALGLMGEGLACSYSNPTFRNAGKVMEELGVERIDLLEKEGLALINGTQFMSSIISEVLFRMESLMESAIAICAFSVEIFGADSNLFLESTMQVYDAVNPSVGAMLRRVAALLDPGHSELHHHRQLTNQQNKHAHSILYCIESLASAAAALTFCKRIVEEEINGATDNPLVFHKEDGFQKDELISAGNFHGEYVAKASDFIGMALFNVGKFSEARCQRYINDRISELPPFLVKDGGLNSGFMIAQYTTAALLSESKVLVKPASVDSISTSASQEDHVSMGGFAARKSSTLLHNVAHILGIELLLCLSAVDFLEKTPSKKLLEIKNKVRESISFMEKDRFFGPDIALAHDYVLADLTKIASH